MKIESSDVTPDRSIIDLDTPALRQQRITALRRELDEALTQLADAATALTVAGAPGEKDGALLSLADRIRWLASNRRT